MSLRTFTAGLAACIALASGPAQARWVELMPGAEGADTAPYQFLAALARGSYDTLYASGSAGHSFETFLRFDLPGDLLDPDEEVARAFLTLYHAIDSFVEDPSAPGPGTLECRETLNDWNEATVTWGNKPAYGPPVDTITEIEELGYLSFQVGDLVAAWAEGMRPNYGFALTSPTPRIIGFYSFEAPVAPGLKARLSIDVQPVPEAGAGVAAAAALAALAGLARWTREQRSAS